MSSTGFFTRREASTTWARKRWYTGFNVNHGFAWITMTSARVSERSRLRQPLERIAARIAAIGPLVVARRVDDRMGQRIEFAQAIGIDGVGARAAAADVAHVQRERDVGAADALEHREVRGFLRCG